MAMPDDLNPISLGDRIDPPQEADGARFAWVEDHYNRSQTHKFKRDNMPKRDSLLKRDNVHSESGDYATVVGKVLKITSEKYEVSVQIEDTTFHVSASLSGRLKVNKIRVVQGDSVMVQISRSAFADGIQFADVIHGRITERLDQR